MEETCKNGHRLTPDNTYKAKLIRNYKSGPILIDVVGCRPCRRMYASLARDKRGKKKKPTKITLPVTMTRLQQLEQMKRQGEQELNKARKEGWLK